VLDITTRPHGENKSLSRKIYEPNTKANLCLDKALSELYVLKTITDNSDKETIKYKIDDIRSILNKLKDLL
jgi:hypothetical protein